MKKINLNVKKFGNVILFLFCLNWSAQIVYGQQNRSVISGYVFDSRRNPVTQIPVELMNDLNSVIQRTKTDGSGRFFFSSVPSGRFTIRVLPLGTDLEQQTQDVEIAGIGVSGRPLADNVQLDFYLRPRKNSGNTITNNGVVFVQEIPEEAKKVFEKAVSDLDDKRIEAGIEGLENALKLFPTYYLALEKLGGLYIGQQKYDKARDIFSRAVTVNERSFYSWYGLSYANYALKQSGPAVEAAKRSVSLNSNSIDALLILGISHRQAKQYQEAEKSLKQAGKVSQGKSSDVHWHLALLYAHNLKRYKDAADQLELYLEANPNNPNKEGIIKLIKQFRENPTSSN